MLNTLKRFWGFQNNVVVSEKVVATIGGMLAIFLCFFLTTWLLGTEGAAAILPSMGASTMEWSPPSNGIAMCQTWN